MNEKAKPSPSVNDVLDPGRALVPQTIRVNEEMVRRDFWPKIRRVASKIPFAGQLLTVWFCARDKETPLSAKGILLASLAYFVLPTDAVPDLIAGLGFTDDAAVIAAVIAVLGRNIKLQHRQAAHQTLARLRGSRDDDPGD